ncbi:MAG TPA: hypothetical protein VL860_07605, partial [Planctomycetota bacterium]|nr:hypothetical protein [Planctomycetota bacterium]
MTAADAVQHRNPAMPTPASLRRLRLSRNAGIAKVLFLVVSLVLGRLGTLTAEEETVITMLENAPLLWQRPAAAIPELPAAPKLDGQRDEAIWAKAPLLPLRFETGSNKAVDKSDTRVFAGHRDGTLYLLVEMDWDAEAAPKSTATQRDKDIWKDDSVEIFLAAAGAMDRPVQLVFNWNSVQGDTAFQYDPDTERALKGDASWDPAWQVKCARGPGVYRATVALPLKDLLGIAAARGDLLRLDVVRNRVAAKPADLHWAPIDGDKNCRPDFFGLAVLAGGDGAKVKLDELRVASFNQIVFPEQRLEPTALRGQPVVFKLLHPLQGLIDGNPFAQLTRTLTGPDGKILVTGDIAGKDADALAFVFQSKTVAEGRYAFHVGSQGARKFASAFQFHWQDCVFVPATDPETFAIHGRSAIWAYPRTVDRQIRSLPAGSSLSFTRRAGAFAVCLPIALPLPGPQVGSNVMQKLRVRVDAGEWQTLLVAASPREVIVADGLPDGEHTVTIEPAGGELWLDGFRITAGRMSRVHGFLRAQQYDELFMDARADLIQNGRVVRSEYVRAPHNGSFEILGLAPGEYTLRFTAAGWEPSQLPVKIDQPGGAFDAGLCTLNRQERLQSWNGDPRPRFGQAVSLPTGAAFTSVCPAWDGSP